MLTVPCRSLADLVNGLYLKYTAYRAALPVFRLPQTILHLTVNFKYLSTPSRLVLIIHGAMRSL